MCLLQSAATKAQNVGRTQSSQHVYTNMFIVHSRDPANLEDTTHWRTRHSRRDCHMAKPVLRPSLPSQHPVHSCATHSRREKQNMTNPVLPPSLRNHHAHLRTANNICDCHTNFNKPLVLLYLFSTSSSTPTTLSKISSGPSTALIWAHLPARV